MTGIDAYTAIICGSAIVLLSFLFNGIAKKTNIPAVLLLIALGVGFQYLLKSLGYENVNFFPVLEILGIVGLIMIVLEAALELELRRDKVPIILRSLLIGLLGLVGSAFAAAAILYYMLPDMSFLQALLYATPLSILSSAIIIPSVGNLSEEKKEFHIYESTFSDILGIMMFYFVLGLMESPAGGEGEGANPVVVFLGSLLLTIVIAVITSYVLLILFQRITRGAKLFLLISILLLLYAIGKKIHLSPLIIILVFGLVVRNDHLFFIGPLRQYLDPERFIEMEKGLHTVTLETAFIVRTFFFVIFGASIALASLLDLQVVLVSLALLGSIYLIRFIFLKLFVGKGITITPQLWIAPRGLITVLLFYAIPAEFASASFDSGVLLFIIIATGIIMTIGLIVSFRRKGQPVPRIMSEDAGMIDLSHLIPSEKTLGKSEGQEAGSDSETPDDQTA